MLIKKLKTIEDVIEDLNRDEYVKKEFDTYQDIIEGIISMGNQEHVYAFDDDHLNLTDNMSPDFLESEINDSNILEKYKEDIENIIDQANTTSFYYNRETTEDIQKEIDEDKMLRGIEDD